MGPTCRDATIRLLAAFVTVAIILAACGQPDAAVGGAPSATPSVQPSAPAEPLPLATAVNVAHAGTPTPVDGLYRGHSFAEAQSITPFRLFTPAVIPASLTYGGWTATPRLELTPTAGTPAIGYGPPDMVTFLFGPAHGGRQSFIELDELGHSIAGPPTGAGPSATSTVEIGGHPVTKTVTHNNVGTEITVYTWQQHGTFCMLSSAIAPPVTAQDVEQLIASIMQ